MTGSLPHVIKSTPKDSKAAHNAAFQITTASKTIQRKEQEERDTDFYNTNKATSSLPNDDERRRRVEDLPNKCRGCIFCGAVLFAHCFLIRFLQTVGVVSNYDLGGWILGEDTGTDNYYTLSVIEVSFAGTSLFFSVYIFWKVTRCKIVKPWLKRVPHLAAFTISITGLVFGTAILFSCLMFLAGIIVFVGLRAIPLDWGDWEFYDTYMPGELAVGSPLSLQATVLQVESHM